MNAEELKEEMRKVQEKMQNEFIDKLLDSITWLSEKVNEKDYEPTSHEREVFSQIINIIVTNNMIDRFLGRIKR